MVSLVSFVDLSLLFLPLKSNVIKLGRKFYEPHIVDENSRELSSLTSLASRLEAENGGRSGTISSSDGVVVLLSGLESGKRDIVEELVALSDVGDLYENERDPENDFSCPSAPALDRLATNEDGKE